MENKKEQRTNWWSIISFIFSIGALGLSFVRVKDTYDLSDTSYISIIITLMGICTTFIVCYQIYNGIEMNRRIAEIERLEESLTDFKTLKFESEGNLELTKGFVYESMKNYDLSFSCYQSALYNYVIANIEDKIDDVLTNMENCLEKIHMEKYSQEMALFKKLSDKIETQESFKEYKRRYNEIKIKINDESKEANEYL